MLINLSKNVGGGVWAGHGSATGGNGNNCNVQQ